MKININIEKRLKAHYSEQQKNLRIILIEINQKAHYYIKFEKKDLENKQGKLAELLVERSSSSGTIQLRFKKKGFFILSKVKNWFEKQMQYNTNINDFCNFYNMRKK